MLDVKNLGRSYGDFKAVDDVSFGIGNGEIVGLLGHNGAGKTTVMKMLSGYLEADEGSIALDGIDIGNKMKTLQSELGYLPENLPVYPEMTVADYLDYAADLKRIARHDKHSEIKRVIEETDLAERINDDIATLSRGYKQRVGVAQAILGKPRLLIMDEPTNGLDPNQTDQMRQLMRKIAVDATVILSTHIMQEVEALCDRVLIMRSGELAVDERLANLQKSNELQLETSLKSAELRTALKDVNGIENLEARPSPGHTQCYLLKIADGVDQTALSAGVASALIHSGGQLYAMQARRRDLESLFREVNSTTVAGKSGEINNAA